MKVIRFGRLFIASLLALSSVIASAQSAEDTERLMNEIKMDETMLYGEDFNEDKGMASNNALYELLTYANELRTDREMPMLLATDLQIAVKEISYSKDGRNFVMVYLPMEEMLSLPKKKGYANKPSPTFTSAAPTATPTPDPSNEPTAAPTPTRHTIKPISASDDVIDILCGQDNWTEIKGFLTDFKGKGKIKDTGFCQTASEVPDDAYSILIDEMYGILAILSPRNSTNRINFRTNQPDSEQNYSNCKVIVWYR